MWMQVNGGNGGQLYVDVHMLSARNKHQSLETASTIGSCIQLNILLQCAIKRSKKREGKGRGMDEERWRGECGREK